MVVDDDSKPVVGINKKSLLLLDAVLLLLLLIESKWCFRDMFSMSALVDGKISSS